MDLLKYFVEDNSGELVQLDLNEELRNEFLDSLPEDFCINYIRKSELEQKALANEMSERDYFEQFIIPEIPSYANVRSGDFGEMLCFKLVKNKADKKGILLVGPRKWRWKADKNKPCHGSDVVLFHKHGVKPSEEDIIESVESKMKATPGNSAPIQNAIDGAIDDKVKRLAKTLNWIHDKLASEGKPRLRESINRYRFLDENPTFKKKFHAIAIIDDDIAQEEIEKEIDDYNDIEITVIRVKDLKNAYESTYNNMLNYLE